MNTSFDNLTIPQLLEELQKYPHYKEKNIKNTIASDLQIKTSQVKKQHLLEALIKSQRKSSKTSKKSFLEVETDKKDKNKVYESMLSNQPSDIKMEILLQLKYPDMLIACNTNKEFNQICNQDMLWNRMIERDFPFYPSDDKDARKSYEHWYKFFDAHTTRIIGGFIIYKTKYINLQDVYEAIFKILVDYIDENNEVMDIEDKEEERKAYEKMIFNMYTKIFKILTVPIKFEERFLKLRPRLLINSTDENMWQYLSQIEYDMMMSYDDPPQ